jgi:hypothetical protein
MALPFTAAEFFEVFRRYNEAVWPFQLALNALALAMLAMVLAPLPASGRLISAMLALLWAWTAAGYHLAFFSAINPAAAVFAVLFIAGAAVFAWKGAVRGRLRFDAAGPLGIALAAYALVAYPLLALALGRGYPYTATFGLPCPSVIFTFGMLACLRGPYPRIVFAAPLAWAAIGSQAAVLFGVYEDLGLLAAGIAGAGLLLEKTNHVRHA